MIIDFQILFCDHLTMQIYKQLNCVQFNFERFY